MCIVICVYGSCGWLFPSKPSSSKLVSLFNRQSGSFGRPNCAVYSLCVMGLNSNGIYTLTVPSNVNSNIFFLNQFIYLLLLFSYLLSSCSDGWLRLGGASIFNQSYCVFIMKLVLQCVMLKNIKTSKNLI